MGSLSGSGTKIPHAEEQLSHNYWGLCVAITEADTKSPCTAKKKAAGGLFLGVGMGVGWCPLCFQPQPEFTPEGALYRTREMPPGFWYWSVG